MRDLHDQLRRRAEEDPLTGLPNRRTLAAPLGAPYARATPSQLLLAPPDRSQPPDATSAADPAFWIGCGFHLAVDDARFPVMRRELD